MPRAEPHAFGSSSSVNGLTGGPEPAGPWPWLDSTNLGAPAGTVGRIWIKGGNTVHARDRD